MKFCRRIILLLIVVTMHGSAADIHANLDIEVEITRALREYCHIIKFPGGWKYQEKSSFGQPLRFDRGEYEFRVEGPLGTRFLVGAYEKLVGDRYDASNIFRLNLSDPTAPVLAASREDWDDAAVVPLTRKSVFGSNPDPLPTAPAKFNGREFVKSGARWALAAYASRLSPDSRWLVLQSLTPTGRPVLSVSKALLFWDVYNTDTGEKVLSFRGTHSAITDDIGNHTAGILDQTGWLTERYFIIPVGAHKERCLVCELGRSTQREGVRK